MKRTKKIKAKKIHPLEIEGNLFGDVGPFSEKELEEVKNQFSQK